MGGTDPYLPRHGDADYGVDHYDLALAYKPAGNRLDATAVLHCTAAREIRTAAVDLHGLKVVKLQAEGAEIERWTHRDGRLRVRFATELAGGTSFRLTIRYAGTPGVVRSKALGDAGWEELEDGVIVAAQPHGAPAWFPCNDRPDDKATYRWEVTVPDEYTVAASGERLSHVRRSGNGVWTFEQRAPMATYLATLQIGRYAERPLAASVPMTVVGPGDLDPAGFEASFGQQPKMLDFFVDRFGPYPFTTYTSVITDDDLEIPLESQSLSTFGRNFATGEWKHVRLVAHELAHQWFGNAVTLGAWKDIWLHEGFACYAEWLWSEEAGVMSAADRALHHHDRLADIPQDLLLTDPGAVDMFDDRVYKRGALALHALRTSVGDDRFFEVLQTWVADNLSGTVSTADFLAHVTRVAGASGAVVLEPWLFARPLPSLP